MRIDGIIPVMLTPFTDDGGVDYDGLERLTAWYLDHGADALFAVCQSSEMQFLTLDERVAVARFVARFVRGRVPVMVSGHIGATAGEQVHELRAMAETGADCLVLVTNRLDIENAGTDAFRAGLNALLNSLPSSLPLRTLRMSDSVSPPARR